MPDQSIEQAIRDNAAAPASITVDGQTVSEHSLPDLIAADKHLAARAAADSPTFGLRFARVVPPGVQ